MSVIINVAGLMLRARPDELDDLMTDANLGTVCTIAPTPPLRAREMPGIAIARAAEQIDAVLARSREAKVFGIGRSYGGFMLLQAALQSRERFARFTRLVMVEAPLHPDQTVVPPALIPPVRLCAHHFRERPGLARKAVTSLAQLGHAPIITISNQADSVVPPDAQRLPEVFPTVDLSGDDLSPVTRLGSSQGLNLVLPPYLGGTSGGGVKAIFPQGYRNHLFWSDEKRLYIQRLIDHIVKS